MAEQEELTRRYADLCRHYGLRATRCNPGQSNENGSIESRHDSLKTALDQALRLRGSRSFGVRRELEAFVDTIVQRMNARTTTLLVIEHSILKALPVRRTAEFEEVSARVPLRANFNQPELTRVKKGMPQDIRISPDGKTLFVADMTANAVV